jgi:hypothetical protein
LWCIAAFLMNAVLWAKGYTQISKYLDLPPPKLEQFLDNTMNSYRNMEINEYAVYSYNVYYLIVNNLNITSKS